MGESSDTLPRRESLRDRLGEWVGLAGGLVGLGTVLGGAVVFSVQYFATREHLERVDCAQHWSIRIIEAQTERRIYQELYADWRAEAVRAEIAHRADANDAGKLAAYRMAVDEQNDAKATHDTAKRRAERFQEERKRCGYTPPRASLSS